MDSRWKVLGVVSMGIGWGSIDGADLKIAAPVAARGLRADLVSIPRGKERRA